MTDKTYKTIITLESLKNHLKKFIDNNKKCEFIEHQETSQRNIITYRATIKPYNNNSINFSIYYNDQYADFSLAFLPSPGFPSADDLSYDSDCLLNPELNELLLSIFSGQLIVEEYKFFNKIRYFRAKNPSVKYMVFDNFGLIRKILFILFPQKPIKTFVFEPY